MDKSNLILYLSLGNLTTNVTILLTVKDSELCPLPSVSSLQLSHIRPHSFLLTWESPDTNMTGLKGFIVAYHRLDMNDQV